jgi:AraC family transcriptional regulator of adaptative response / DNA-3-methyladenine glycosylase II
MVTPACDGAGVIPDFDQCYRAVESKDARFDGWFFTAVKTTGIYCRPSCPARTPYPRNVEFFPTAAAAQRAGYRACKRCRPDASPGSPEWDPRGDVVARAMRLIGDGVVDREGVSGLARRLAYSERQLHRLLVAELGAGPLALARAQRAQTARVLIETTDLRFADIAFASGFASIRQFNDTIREVFASTPSVMRSRGGVPAEPGSITVRLAARAPFAGADVLGFLTPRTVTGIEAVDAGGYHRSLALPHGNGLLTLTPGPDAVTGTFRLADLRDLTAAVARTRRLFDLDADPVAVDAALGRDPLLRGLIRRRPGLRVPGHPDGFELVVRAVVGQQVSVAGARTILGRFVTKYGKPLDAPTDTLTHVFPDAATMATIDPAELPMPKARATSLVGVATAIADGRVVIDPGSDREQLRAQLLALPGIGPWTVEYVMMRAVGDPDAFLASDLGVRRALEARGLDGRTRAASERAEAWRPWRAYANAHLWMTQGDEG